jgi:hypothetical protein
MLDFVARVLAKYRGAKRRSLFFFCFICQYAWHVVDQLSALVGVLIQVGSVHIRLSDEQFCIADHHMGNILAGVPGGSSDDRDYFSRASAEHFGVILMQDDPSFTIESMLNRYLKSVGKSPCSPFSTV